MAIALTYFTLDPTHLKLWGEFSASIGGCAEATEWCSTYRWEDMLDPSAAEPYPTKFAYWRVQNLFHRASPELRQHYMNVLAMGR